MTASSFGILLRKYRLTAGLTQRDLAAMAGLDFSYISKLENNRLPPPAADTVVLLCSILGAPTDDLLASTRKLPSTIEANVSANASAQMFLREAQSLTEQQWLQLSRQLHTLPKRNSMVPTRASAYDFSQWASRFDAPGQLPEFVRRLILATARNITLLQIRSDEGTRYGGYDGVLQAEHGNAFVPNGLSVWEMGVDPKPKRKADEDYKKRTANPLGIDPSQATFVFVTPCRWSGKEDWAVDKRQKGFWRDIRVLDADDLATWVALAPAVHIWISRLLGLDPGNIQDLESFWLDWREATQPVLSAELITAGQEMATQQLIQQLQTPASTMIIQADAREEVLAFIAAAFERLPELEQRFFFARSLIVYSADAWHQITLSTQPLVLLPMFAPVEAVQATRKGHHVLVPVGRETANARGMMVLQHPSRPAAEAALGTMGVPQERVPFLASIAHRSLLSLRRQLAVNPALQQPTWATHEHARSLLPTLLAGNWDEVVEGDRDIIEALTGHSYADVEANLVGYAHVSDPPVRKVGTTWLFVSKEDAWRLLARFLTRQDLERFRQATSKVLTALDPALELPVEKRWQANVSGHARPHSHFLREGLADTLALIATRSVSEWSSGSGTGQSYANALVVQLLQQANDDQSGQTWISFADVLPLLAEAAPEVFLNALDIATTGANPVILQLFTDQSGDMFTTQSAHTSLLRALEQLAWSPMYLSRVALFLARLARLDSGGRLANRPGRSLRCIFVVWYPQTAATFEERLDIIDRLREQEPTISWKLMVALLPSPHAIADSIAGPRWRDWKPEEREVSFTYADVWRATEMLIIRLIQDIGGDGDRIGDLIERIENLPSPLRTTVLDHLESLNPAVFDTNSRGAICAKLREQIAKHRRFSQAPWAISSEDIDRLKAIYERFEPEEKILQALPLFTASPLLLDEPEEPDRMKHESAVYEAQVTAAYQVYQFEGLMGLFTLVEKVEQPGILGWILGRSGLVEEEEDHILHELGSSDAKRHRLAAEYVSGRFSVYAWEWVDERLRSNVFFHTFNQQANFLLNLPPKAETWNRLESLGDDTIKLYWTQFHHLVEDPIDCLRAAEQLLFYEQAWSALDLVAHYLERVQPSAEFVMNILEKAIDTPLSSPIDQVLLYEIPQLLEYLEQSTKADEIQLARIELAVLPLFRYEKRPFKALYHQLARDPQFFIELVCLAYRASDEAPHEVSEREQARAQIAYDLLHSINEVPGTQDGDLLDWTKLTAWVEEVRKILGERKRKVVGDLCIGQVLSHAKPEANDVWPPNAIRELLEQLHSEDVERGMELALYNARGATWRSLTDGGVQERQLMKQYRSQSQSIQARWPRTAAMLRRLAQSYEEEAQMHDYEAELRQNGW